MHLLKDIKPSGFFTPPHKSHNIVQTKKTLCFKLFAYHLCYNTHTRARSHSFFSSPLKNFLKHCVIVMLVSILFNSSRTIHLRSFCLRFLHSHFDASAFIYLNDAVSRAFCYAMRMILLKSQSLRDE